MRDETRAFQKIQVRGARVHKLKNIDVDVFKFERVYI